MFGKSGIRFQRVPILIVAVLVLNGVFTAEIRHKKSVSTSAPATLAKGKDDQSAARQILTRNHGDDLESEETGIMEDNVQAESSHGVRGYEDSEYEHVATYSTHSNALNPIAVIAISIFGVLALLILLQLLGVRTFRSMSSSPFSVLSLPFEWNFNSEMLPDIITKVIDVVEKLEQNASSTKRSRPKRELGQAPSILEWMSAYKKDPNDYECVRKLACETLAHSSIVAESMKSKIGSTIMSTIKFFFEDGTMLVETIKDVLKNPDKCVYLFSEEVCDEPKSNSSTRSSVQKKRL